MNHRVFIDSAKDKRVARRIRRDVTTRGRSVEEVNERFENNINKMHEQYVAPNKQKSDIVIENNRQLSAAKQQLEHWIKKTIY
jgi:uridine kinase